jgi:tRNA threonylcarbamoyladenosine biosynthesis protein TsaE
MEFSYNIKDISKAVHNLMPVLIQHKIITLNGEMGAGKTTLVSEVCKQLNCKQEASSPTYAIINIYETLNNNIPFEIVHMDWYRLKDEEDVFKCGASEYLEAPNTMCFIEWSNKAPRLLNKYLEINIETISQEDRKISLSTFG